jgi:translation initiation factor 1
MKSRTATAGGLVYSTESGKMCPACRHPIATCVCKKTPSLAAAGDGVVRVSYEKKGRAGKAVTLIQGVPLALTELTQLAKELKTACGSGGTVKDGTIEIQGDHRDRVMERLKPHGWAVKRAGG